MNALINDCLSELYNLISNVDLRIYRKAWNIFDYTKYIENVPSDSVAKMLEARLRTEFQTDQYFKNYIESGCNLEFDVRVDKTTVVFYIECNEI